MIASSARNCRKADFIPCSTAARSNSVCVLKIGCSSCCARTEEAKMAVISDSEIFFIPINRAVRGSILQYGT
jgi:hypothetical protein